MGSIIDIWSGNTVTDWNKVAQSTDLVIIRSQYGSLKEDKKWREHVAGCKSVGLPFGMYAYGCYESVEDARVEAKDFLKRVDPAAKFLAVDVEEDTVKACGTENLAVATQAFIDVLKAAGYKVGYYVSHYLYKQYGLDGVKADFLWLPRYGNNDGTPQIKPTYYCDLWQYSDVGCVPGIQGEVDLNQLCGDKDLFWFIGRTSVAGGSTQLKGIGIATSKYPNGYGVNLYTKPVDGAYIGRITDKTPYLILGGYWLGGDNNMLCLGGQQWAKQQHFDVQWFYAYSKYPKGYGVNYYDGPNGNFLGRVDGSVPYSIYARKDGWIDIGQNRWLEEKHFNVK